MNFKNITFLVFAIFYTTNHGAAAADVEAPLAPSILDTYRTQLNQFKEENNLSGAIDFLENALLKNGLRWPQIHMLVHPDHNGLDPATRQPFPFFTALFQLANEKIIPYLKAHPGAYVKIANRHHTDFTPETAADIARSFVPLAEIDSFLKANPYPINFNNVELRSFVIENAEYGIRNAIQAYALTRADWERDRTIDWKAHAKNYLSRMYNLERQFLINMEPFFRGTLNEFTNNRDNAIRTLKDTMADCYAGKTNLTGQEVLSCAERKHKGLGYLPLGGPSTYSTGAAMLRDLATGSASARLETAANPAAPAMNPWAMVPSYQAAPGYSGTATYQAQGLMGTHPYPAATAAYGMSPRVMSAYPAALGYSGAAAAAPQLQLAVPQQQLTLEQRRKLMVQDINRQLILQGKFLPEPAIQASLESALRMATGLHFTNQQICDSVAAGLLQPQLPSARLALQAPDAYAGGAAAAAAVNPNQEIIDYFVMQHPMYQAKARATILDLLTSLSPHQALQHADNSMESFYHSIGLAKGGHPHIGAATARVPSASSGAAAAAAVNPNQAIIDAFVGKYSDKDKARARNAIKGAFEMIATTKALAGENPEALARRAMERY